MLAYQNKWLAYAVGYVFITSGIMKLLNPDFKYSFINLDLPFPLTTLFLVAMIEIICGSLIAVQICLKYITIPLVIIMIGALYLTKLPILLNKGFLLFLFEARLDIVMLILLILIRKRLHA